MCGRFVQAISAEQYLEVYRVLSAPNLPPRYNVAPGQPVTAVRREEDGQRSLVSLRWGLIPAWAKDPDAGYKMINARSETVQEKPSFRQAMKSRRCIIPANGFYEWQKAGKEKLPHFVRMVGGDIMSLAGLWERWISPEGEVIESCTILTTDANRLLKPIHQRMPVILDPDAHDRWLSYDRDEDFSNLLSPYPADRIEAYRVSTDVNKPSNDSRDNLRPISK